MATRYGWHIVQEDRRLLYGDGRMVRVGTRMEWKKQDRMDKIEVCKVGMHASPTPYDAYTHIVDRFDTLDCWLCRVRIEGTGRGSAKNRKADERFGAKFVGTHRTALGMIPFREVWTWTSRDPVGFAADPVILEAMRRRNRKNGVKIEVR